MAVAWPGNPVNPHTIKIYDKTCQVVKLTEQSLQNVINL